MEVDHALPKSKGGLDTMGNLVTACIPCNQGKKTLESDPREHVLLEQIESEVNVILRKREFGGDHDEERYIRKWVVNFVRKRHGLPELAWREVSYPLDRARLLTGMGPHKDTFLAFEKELEDSFKDD